MKQLVLRAVMTFILCMVIVVSSMVLIFALPVKAAYEEDESVSTYVTDKACSFSLFPWKVGGTPTTSIDKLKGTYKDRCRQLGERESIPAFKHKILKDIGGLPIW